MGQQKSTHHHRPDLHKIRIDKSKRGISFGLAAMRGWRHFMEDTHISILNFNDDPELSLFAVFDGHAGCQVAIFVRDEFPKQLKKNSHFHQGNYSQALKETFVKMDQMLQSDAGIRKLEEIIEQQCNEKNAKNLFGESNAGCTALVCLVTPWIIFVANAGDSKGIAHSNNACIQINTEHKPNVKSEVERIILAGGTIRDDRIMGEINITRCIGDFSYKKNFNLERNQQMIICDPEILQIDRGSCDYIMIGSDGIWESKDNLAMHNWLTGHPSDMKISQKLSHLFDEEVSKIEDTEFGKDNMTAILIKFD